MARSNNLPAKKYKAGERTITKLRFNVDFSQQSGQACYIDIGQALSMVNQRAYRQGLYYYVAGVTVHNSGDAWLRFSTAPDTWMTKASWARGFKLWSSMNRKALETSQDKTMSLYPKYHDYKIFLDDDHIAKSSSADDGGNQIITPGNIAPHTYPKHGAVGGIALTADEWAMSMYTSPDPGNTDTNDIQLADSFTAHIVGSHEYNNNECTSVALIRSYHNTRDITQSYEPAHYSSTTPNNDPLFLLFDDGDTHQEILDDVLDFNDQTPYNRDGPFGSGDDHLQLQVQVATTDESHIAMGPGFCAPFGLVRVDSSDNGTIEFVLDLVPGPYNGVYAERVL